MKQFSVVMPSNRNLSKSQRAIETALAFCEARNGYLIVSDNSRDPEKENHWRAVDSDALIYLGDGPEISGENSMRAMRRVETPFLFPMGDDDELFSVDGVSPVDLQTLGEDHIGVRPFTEIFTTVGGHKLQRCFGLEGETPGERLRQYQERNEGENTAFYSIFRTKAYLSLMEFFLREHPTKGAYSDWQLAMALFISGKLAYDPSVLFRYNGDAWVTAQQIKENGERLHTDVGLPADFWKFEALARSVDLFIFSMRRDSGMKSDDVAALQAHELSERLDELFMYMVYHANDYGASVVALCKRGRQSPNPMLKLHSAISILDIAVAGMRNKYIEFMKAAMKS